MVLKICVKCQPNAQLFTTPVVRSLSAHPVHKHQSRYSTKEDQSANVRKEFSAGSAVALFLCTVQLTGQGFLFSRAALVCSGPNPGHSSFVLRVTPTQILRETDCKHSTSGPE